MKIEFTMCSSNRWAAYRPCKSIRWFVVDLGPLNINIEL